MLRVGYGISGTNILSVGRGVSVGGGGGGGFVGPYDSVPDITAAYGMRRLRSAYTGSILRLRRSSDNAEEDIGYTSAGDLDTAAIAAFIGAGSGFVTTWYDQSGNGHHAVQSTAAAQPLRVAGGVKFDGSNDYLDTGVVPVNDQTWSMLARFSGVTVSPSCVAGVRNGGTPDFSLFPRVNDNRSYRNGASLTVAGGAISAGVMALAGNLAYLDGVQESGTIGSASNDFGGHAIYIGARNREGQANDFADATVHELIISGATYTAGQIAAITGIMEAA